MLTNGQMIRNAIRLALIIYCLFSMFGSIKKEKWGNAIIASMLISITFSTLEEKRGT